MDDYKKVDTKACFGFCRDCKRWEIDPDYSHEEVAKWPRDRRPRDGWYVGRCAEIEHGVDIEISAGWGGGVVDNVKTNSNFGCCYFEAK